MNIERQLAQIEPDDVRRVSEAAKRHDIDLYTVIAAASCDHRFENGIEIGPNGQDQFGRCSDCGVDREFLQELGWDVGSYRCSNCCPKDFWCVECDGSGWIDPSLSGQVR